MIPKFEEGSLDEQIFFLSRQTPDHLSKESIVMQMGCDPPYIYPDGTVIRFIWITEQEFEDHFMPESPDIPV